MDDAEIISPSHVPCNGCTVKGCEKKFLLPTPFLISIFQKICFTVYKMYSTKQY